VLLPDIAMTMSRGLRSSGSRTRFIRSLIKGVSMCEKSNKVTRDVPVEANLIFGGCFSLQLGANVSNPTTLLVPTFSLLDASRS
jgi:hypothetical protein